MVKSFHPKEPNMQQTSDFLASLRIFDSILPLMRRSVKWLADFIQLTEEEREDAGIHLGCLGAEQASICLECDNRIAMPALQSN